MKQDTGIKSSQWSQLPLDLSQQTIDRLYYYDQIRFRAVCKTWNAAQYKRKPTDSLPWVIKVEQTSIHMFECLLYQQAPLNVFKPVEVDKIDLNLFVTSYPSSYFRGIEISCKSGWLLFKIPDKDFRGVTLLYYSPLTKKSILLPYLLYRVSSYCRSFSKVITASSVEPDSPDCVFVALEYDCVNNQKHIISTFRHGENRWCVTEYFGRNFTCSDCIAVYVRKIFYFVNACGEVASYNVRDSNWKVEAILGDNAFRQSWMRYLIELKGELMILYFDEFIHCRLKVLDWSTKAWVPVYSLESQALLVSPNSFSVLVGGEEATNNGLLANKIYILDIFGSLKFAIFSVKTGDFVNRVNGDMYETVSEISDTFWLELPDQFLKRKQSSRTNDDVDHVAADRRVVGLKRSRSGSREPLAANVKHYGMDERGKHSRSK